LNGVVLKERSAAHFAAQSAARESNNSHQING
jgi:hypothetical protein